MAGIANFPISLALGSLGNIQEASVVWKESFRIIASEYAGENLFDRLAGDDELDDLRAIADLTSPHVLHAMGVVDLVKPGDRLYGLGAGFIMAAFAWPGKPSRFSDGSNGTYYTALAEETARAETAYHDEQFLKGSGPVMVEKTLVVTDLSSHLVDIRGGRPCPDGVYDSTDYTQGQAFGGVVRRLDGFGIVYDSVRHSGGQCAAIFRPPALSGARAVRTLEYHWDGNRMTRIL